MATNEATGEMCPVFTHSLTPDLWSLDEQWTRVSSQHLLPFSISFRSRFTFHSRSSKFTPSTARPSLPASDNEEAPEHRSFPADDPAKQNHALLLLAWMSGRFVAKSGLVSVQIVSFDPSGEMSKKSRSTCSCGSRDEIALTMTRYQWLSETAVAAALTDDTRRVVTQSLISAAMSLFTSFKPSASQAPLCPGDQRLFPHLSFNLSMSLATCDSPGQRKRPLANQPNCETRGGNCCLRPNDWPD